MDIKIEKQLQISINAKSGSGTSGIVTLTEKEGKVTLEAHINGLSEGTHAIHIHEKLTVVLKTERLPGATGIQHLKIMVLGVLLQDFTVVILEIFRPIRKAMAWLISAPIFGVSAVKILRKTLLEK